MSMIRRTYKRRHVGSIRVPFRSQITRLAAVSKLNYERARRPFLCHPRGNGAAPCGTPRGPPREERANLNDDQARAFHRADVPICRDGGSSPELSRVVPSKEPKQQQQQVRSGRTDETENETDLERERRCKG